MELKMEILLATYNGEKFLREQLDSLLKQTWKQWHLTVSDDGSTDGTVAIVDEYAERYPECIRRVYHKGRFGNARDHFFWLMGESSAPYLMFCDQDDVWHDDKVEKTMKAMLCEEAKHEPDTPILVFTDLTPVDESLHPIQQSLMKMQQQNPKAISYEQILFQNIVTGCTVAVNQALAKLADRCRSIDGIVMHDWWLAIVAARYGQIVYVNECTMDYRQHSSNSVGAQDVRSVSYICYKVKHLNDFRKHVMDKKRQALVFKDTYEKDLRKDELKFLAEFGMPKSPMRFKWSYLKWIQTPLRKVGFWLKW